MGSDESRFLDLTLALILAVAVFGMMGGALIGPALPAIDDPFNVSESTVALVLSVYLLSTSVAMPFIGFLIDKYGRKTVLVPCLLINGVFGGLCSIAPSFEVLLVFRAIQGIGIAGMSPVAMTLIGDLYRGLSRTKAMGYLSAVMSIGGITSPIIGGGLAALAWNYPFYFYLLNLPLALFVWLWLPSPEVEAKGLKEYLKPFVESFKDLRVVAVLLSGYLTFFLLYAVVTYLPFILTEEPYGFSTFVAGIIIGVQGISIAIISINADKLEKIISSKRLILLGFFLHGLAIIWLPYEYPLASMFIFLFVFGVGRGFVMPQINTLITKLAPEKGIGGLVAVFNTLRFIGMGTSPVVLGIIRDFADLKAVFLFSAALAFIAALIGLMAGNIHRGIIHRE